MLTVGKVGINVKQRVNLFLKENLKQGLIIVEDIEPVTDVLIKEVASNDGGFNEPLGEEKISVTQVIQIVGENQVIETRRKVF